MSERSVLVSQVAVYHYNAGSQRWDPLWPAEAASATGSSTPSPCRLFLTVGPEADESRILAFTTLPGEGTPPDAASTTSEGGFALLNTRLYANAQLECRAHFVQWRASSSLVIGLSFATTDQASSFVNGFRQVIAQLGASLASTQKVPSLGTLPATQSNDGERKMSRRKSFRQQTGSKLGLFTRHKDSSDSLLAPVSSAVASTSSGPISSNPSSTSATSAPGDDSLPVAALHSSRLTKSSSNLSTVIAEGERALVIQVGSADLLKKAGMSGRTVRISINKETTTTKARRLVVDLLTQDAPEDVRESTTSMLAPCHLILTIGGVEKSLSKGEDLFSLALSMPSLRFDIPGLFTQISPPKFTCVRDQKAYEVYQSELAYVKTLDKIVNTLMKSSQTVLSMADSAQLFCNSDQLLVLHTRILNAVRHRLVDEWSQEALIGDIFLDDSYDFRIYQTYYSNYDTIPDMLATLQKRKDVRAWLEDETVVQACSGLGLLNLLIQPCQRLPRYSLLIRELQKETPEDHPDHANLNRAFTELGRVARNMNDAVRSTANAKMLNDLLRKTDSYIGFLPFLKRKGPDAAKQPYSNLLFYSDVEVQLGVISYTWMLLFDDQLVFASSEPVLSRGKQVGTRYKLEVSLPLGYIWIEDMAGAQNDLLRVVHPTNTFLVKTQSVSQKQTWITTGSSAVEAFADSQGFLTTVDGEVVRCFEHEMDFGTWKGQWQSGLPSGQGVLMMDNRNEYTGHMHDGKIHGHGVMNYKDGSVYEGEWVKNKPHGKGNLTTVGGKYEGQWANGRREGVGKLTWPNDDIYMGEWKEDLMCGKGKLMLKTESIVYSGTFEKGVFQGRGELKNVLGVYDGEWKSGLRDGKGRFEGKDGSVYDGEWKNDRKHGQGRLVAGADNKFVYQGEFVDGLFHGTGSLEVNDAFVYSGEFKEGRQHGRGVMRWADGASYEGGWADDRRSGQGKMIESDGSVYDGHWHNDKRFGRGTFVAADKSRYDGEWVKGRKEGKGVLTLPSGAKYSGSWTADKRHGRGVFAFGPVKYVGCWENDVRHGKGTLSSPDGVYDGSWVNDKPDGVGVLKNGNYVYEGKWKDGRRHGHGKVKLPDQQDFVEVEYQHGTLKADPSKMCLTFPLIPYVFRT
eukprot:CAMPEP_0177631430 /NCGR_PEP_ID=MMETSP0447-20121125/1746_1 /TAXON_ID=0 /ORGANISM="Stygamoeba regulata, Strain BSH-02190019" /LENGTH=1131 /DNA_ID=CAMNT_0019132915 /DNA_START=101 /DNA_END=3497 /DNA_ORIENTATION=-